ncbi:ion transporter [Shewanella sp. SR43-4]|jgi:voltage-gated potassium channel|uniref:Ion transporter n=1 Tax=Shewanella vesiculosa TaxID=518738 RepID=A0ABV0FX52_9GAMM|nr:MULTISPECIES: ion transporter [Shewanella]NCQ46813.1 ion transporter [Shewanella frigidimarina]MBB1319422.1 ion transporter [Shewanella sp. SR43-4]MBB1323773.1 ion transporter [Shewanella sp. SR43-8]MBB1391297.1 ion transporter [Shewanella sp. SG44-6]MBB1477617.1 ion transporter [Shewanella sp. SG41-3]|tara:strand:- start:90 stop:920 length:831 start_codon:yes stop_codon:yes gene_type:complete
MNTEEKADSPLKQTLRSVIFGTETPAGKRFDIALMICIVLSVTLIFIDTIGTIHAQYGDYIRIGEWTFTVIFTVEYILRLYCSLNRLHYARSFFGVVDLVSILPSYLGLIFPGANLALAIRVLRLFRVFRVLKLLRYLSDGNILLKAMILSSRKVFLFFFSVSLIIMVLSVIMYVVEGPVNGFTSIPKSMYWTIVTITTVGYGDITPQTTLGQGIAALTMLIGYSIIAIPTGILTAEISNEMVRTRDLRKCNNCGKKGHDNDAEYCNHCGSELEKL